MIKVAGTQVRRGTYYLNLRVPPAIKGAYDGQTHLRRSLKTSDPKQAEREVMLYKAEFHHKEQEVSRKAHIGDLVEKLPPDQRALFDEAGGTLEGLLNAFDLSKASLALSAVGADDYDSDAPTSASERRMEEARDRAASSVLQQDVTREGKTLRALGESVAIPGGDVTGLRELANAYIEVEGTPKLSQRAYMYPVRRFIELHGDIPLAELTMNHLRIYETELKRLTPSRKGGAYELSFEQNAKVAKSQGLALMTDTARAKAVSHLKYLTKWAPSKGYLENDPFAGFKVSKTKKKFSDQKKVRDPFDGDQIAIILKYVREHRHPQTIDYWGPLLATYQGARREEIAQMRLCDVTQIDGEWIMRITDEGDDGKVKNRASLRNIPIHPAVEDAGFLEFVQGRQGAPDDYLFREETRKGNGKLRELSLDADERVSGRYGKRFAADLKAMKIKRAGLVYHSFRHSWETAAEHAEMKETHRRALAGRSGAQSDSQDGYGDGPSIRQGRDALAKIDPLALETGQGMKGDR